MARMFGIKNWTRFQHYKDRNPPWIKLHVEILASEDWVTLDDASKLLMLVCMMIAAKHDGCVPDNPAYIRRVSYTAKLPNLKPLIACGFLVPLADASTMLADARPEKETETETETEKNMSDVPSDARAKYSPEFEEFWKAYPTDRIMSKKKAGEQWARIADADRKAAMAAVPAFKDYCRKNTTYRPVHAERFLSQRRFDGFEQATMDPAEMADRIDRADKLFRRGKYADAP